MSSPFAQPSAGGDKFEPGDFNGRLLLFYPKSYNPSETTKFGPSTSADADIIVVDAIDPTTGQPTIKFNARVFGNLANSVRDSIGAVVLGRLGQGPNTKGNPPWILLPHNDADADASSAVHAQYQAGQFKQPERPAQAAVDPWAVGPVGVSTPALTPTAYPYPPAATPAAAAPVVPPAVAPAQTADPNIALLISKGIDVFKVMEMDPPTRAMLASTYQ